MAYPEAISTPDSRGMLPLHLACRYGGHSSYQIILLLIRLWPEALRRPANLSKSKQNMLPLHIACDCGPMPLKILKLIIERYPEAIFTPNGNGDLPIHIACKGYHVKAETVKYLISQLPDSVKTMNTKGELPLHIIAGRRGQEAHKIIEYLFLAYPESITISNGKGELALHCACSANQPLEIVKLLFAKFDDAVQVPDSKGMLPIHHACSTYTPILPVIAFLAQSHPKGLRQRCLKGDLPLHCACRYSSIEAIKYLLEVYPEAAKNQTGKDNLLPLQLICRKKKPSPAAVKLLAEAFPEGVETLCGTDGLAVNMARRCRSESCEVLNYLSRMSPCIEKSVQRNSSS
jgi:ankyrin repeat protein